MELTFWNIFIIIIGVLSATGWCLYAYDMCKKIKDKNKKEVPTNKLNYKELPYDIESSQQ
jgi:hypothetical protein